MKGQPIQLQSLRSEFNWYVARVEHGKESQAADHLKSVGFGDTFVPLIMSDRTTRINHAPRTYPLRSGYVFCETLLFTPCIWHLACPANGLRHHGLVKGFLGGWPAAPVANASIEDMRSRCDADGVYIQVAPAKVHYLHGALVRLLDDAWMDHVFKVIFDDGRGVNVQALQNQNFCLYTPRERVQPITNGRTEALPLSVVASSRTGAPIGKPVSEARTKRTRRGFRKVRSCAAA